MDTSLISPSCNETYVSARSRAQSGRNVLLAKMVATGVVLVLSTGCGAYTAGSGVAGETLVTEAAGLTGPDVIDLGVVATGGRHTEIVRFINNGRHERHITSMETSCPCATVAVDRESVAAAGHAFARVEVDFRKEPDFTGEMLIEVFGMDDEGKDIVTFGVRVCVVPAIEVRFAGEGNGHGTGASKQ